MLSWLAPAIEAPCPETPVLVGHALERPAMKTALRHLMPQLALPAIPSEKLARIRVPTSLIWGRHDLQVRLQVALEASARYGWPLHVIEHAAYDPAFERCTYVQSSSTLSSGASVSTR